MTETVTICTKQLPEDHCKGGWYHQQVSCQHVDLQKKKLFYQWKENSANHINFGLKIKKEKKMKETFDGSFDFRYNAITYHKR